MRLTWKQFKDEVDKQLAEAGKSEDVPIEYIDISWPCSAEDVNAVVGKDGLGLAI